MSYLDIDEKTGLSSNIEIKDGFIRMFRMLIDFELLRPGFRERAVRAICNYRGTARLLLSAMSPIEDWDLICTHVTLFEGEDGNMIVVCSPKQEYVDREDLNPAYHIDALYAHSNESVCEKCGGFIYTMEGHLDDCPHQVVFEVLKS